MKVTLEHLKVKFKVPRTEFLFPSPPNCLSAFPVSVKDAIFGFNIKPRRMSYDPNQNTGGFLYRNAKHLKNPSQCWKKTKHS